MKEYNMTEDIAENLSVWHIKIKAGSYMLERWENRIGKGVNKNG